MEHVQLMQTCCLTCSLEDTVGSATDTHIYTYICRYELQTPRLHDTCCFTHTKLANASKYVKNDNNNAAYYNQFSTLLTVG